MLFHIITIFPKIFDSYVNESILKRAQTNKLITIKTHDVRQFTKDKHKKVDDAPYGGGAGMVLKAEPILRAVESITKGKKSPKRKIVILSAKGKSFDQKTANTWAKKYKEIIFISGRYEGIDERVKIALKAEEVSIGPYVLTDGDVAAMTIISSVARLLPGVIKSESLKEESHSYEHGLEYPQYTKAEIITWKKKKYQTPKVLLSGNHGEIARWRTGIVSKKRGE